MSQNNNFTLSSIRDFMYRVYGWMGASLALSGAVAWGVATSPAILNVLFKHSFVIWILFFLELGLVFLITNAAKRLDTVTASLAFIAFAILNGLTLSSIFLIYTLSSIAATFAIAASMFLTMALYGYFTKSDLSSMGSYLLMGMVGLFISGIVNIFLKSSGFSFLISIFGVIIFTLMTAYDAQKIKSMAQELSGTGMPLDALAINCALILYLDFINLFLYLLRMFGKRKD